MSRGPIEELMVPYDSAELEQLVERRRRRVRGRIISLGITLVILTLLYLWRREQLGGPGVLLTVYGIAIAVSLAWLAVVVVMHRRARADLAAVGEGIAVRIGRPGVQLGRLWASWPEVSSLAVVKGGFGRSPQLRLVLTDGRQADVGMNQISVYPATLDSTARAYSAGRHGVDLSALDL